jgi:hypothetical protein
MSKVLKEFKSLVDDIAYNRGPGPGLHNILQLLGYAEQLEEENKCLKSNSKLTKVAPAVIQAIRNRYNEANRKWEHEGDMHKQGYAMGMEFTVSKLDMVHDGLYKEVWPND